MSEIKWKRSAYGLWWARRSFLKAYFDHLLAATLETFAQTPDESVVEVTLPFYSRDGDHVTMYLRQDEKGRWEVSNGWNGRWLPVDDPEDLHRIVMNQIHSSHPGAEV